MVTCKNCKKRLTCKTLCRAAEEYVNQDFVAKKHNTLRYANMDDFVLQPHGTYKLYHFPIDDDYGEESSP